MAYKRIPRNKWLHRTFWTEISPPFVGLTLAATIAIVNYCGLNILSRFNQNGLLSLLLIFTSTVLTLTITVIMMPRIMTRLQMIKSAQALKNIETLINTSTRNKNTGNKQDLNDSRSQNKQADLRQLREKIIKEMKLLEIHARKLDDSMYLT